VWKLSLTSREIKLRIFENTVVRRIIEIIERKMLEK
jgi:hypothetical protein